MVMAISDPLTGRARGTIDEVLTFIAARDVSRPAELRAYCQEIFSRAPTVGLDPAILIAQSALETGFWTSPAWTNRLNPAGIGIGDEQNVSLLYENGTDAARAHLVHAFVYAIGPIAPNHPLAPFRSLDPRYDAVIDAGWAVRVHDIGDLTGRWATDPDYATKIVTRGNEIFPNLPIAGM